MLLCYRVKGTLNGSPLLCRLPLLIRRVISNIIILLLLAGSSYAIYVVVERIGQTTSATSVLSAIQQGWTGVLLFIQSFQVKMEGEREGGREEGNESGRNEIGRERKEGERDHFSSSYKPLSSFATSRCHTYS